TVRARERVAFPPHGRGRHGTVLPGGRGDPRDPEGEAGRARARRNGRDPWRERHRHGGKGGALPPPRADVLGLLPGPGASGTRGRDGRQGEGRGRAPRARPPEAEPHPFRGRGQGRRRLGRPPFSPRETSRGALSLVLSIGSAEAGDRLSVSPGPRAQGGLAELLRAL